MKNSLLKPDRKNSLFVCKVYFDRPNIHDPEQHQQKRFYSFDYAQERQRKISLEELGDESKLLAFNGYRRMVDWIEKAKKDHYFKVAYIYANQHLDEKGWPMELRIFTPYQKEPSKSLTSELCKPHWQHSLFKLEVSFEKRGIIETKTIYSQDYAHERKQGLPSHELTEEVKAFYGYRYLVEKGRGLKKMYSGESLVFSLLKNQPNPI